MNEGHLAFNKKVLLGNESLVCPGFIGESSTQQSPHSQLEVVIIVVEHYTIVRQSGSKMSAIGTIRLFQALRKGDLIILEPIRIALFVEFELSIEDIGLVDVTVDSPYAIRGPTLRDIERRPL